MKRLLFLSLAVFEIAAAAEPTGKTGAFMVREWGTFTSVSGSDGTLLSGLEREEHALPLFVYSHAGFAPGNKGWNRPVTGVTVKMETPVLYFYSDAPRQVRVEVGFRGGSISQWYPERSPGEKQLPPPVGPGARPPAPVDFAKGYSESATWAIDVLAPADRSPINARRDWETREWPRARVGGANRVRGARGEVEGFVFYRGLGNFALPLTVTAAADGSVSLRNVGAETFPFVWVYEKTAAGEPARSWTGTLAGGETARVRVADTAAVDFHGALVRAGLSGAEASALIATWRESYFDRAGLRVFWIVPRSFVDAVLPLTITPTPDNVERVLVGRTEVLTPAFEAQLWRDFAADGGRRWQSDRYFAAYRERAARWPATVGVAHTGATR